MMFSYIRNCINFVFPKNQLPCLIPISNQLTPLRPTRKSIYNNRKKVRKILNCLFWSHQWFDNKKVIWLRCKYVIFGLLFPKNTWGSWLDVQDERLTISIVCCRFFWGFDWLFSTGFDVRTKKNLFLLCSFLTFQERIFLAHLDNHLARLSLRSSVWQLFTFCKQRK